MFQRSLPFGRSKPGRVAFPAAPGFRLVVYLHLFSIVCAGVAAYLDLIRYWGLMTLVIGFVGVVGLFVAPLAALVVLRRRPVRELAFAVALETLLESVHLLALLPLVQ